MRNYYSNEESAEFLTATKYTPTLLGINFWIVIFFKLYPESYGKVVSESKKINIQSRERREKLTDSHRSTESE